MTFTVQVVVDCTDPHPLADWWAETLGWQVEPQDGAFIRRMIAEGQASEADTTTHHGALVWRVGAAITSGEPQHLRVLFQQVPEGKTVKNRLHFDVRTGEADVETVRARLIERGATRLYEGRQGPFTWVTMADPEGNEFCV
jgi:Glyoxalase-like domain